MHKWDTLEHKWYNLEKQQLVVSVTPASDYGVQDNEDLSQLLAPFACLYPSCR